MVSLYILSVKNDEETSAESISFHFLTSQNATISISQPYFTPANRQDLLVLNHHIRPCQQPLELRVERRNAEMYLRIEISNRPGNLSVLGRGT